MASILVVEDEASIRKLAAVNLVARGHHVIEAGSAEDALPTLRDADLSLLILDIKLPGMQGWDLLAQMASDDTLPSDLPVIVMSASAADIAANVTNYPQVVQTLAKPF